MEAASDVQGRNQLDKRFTFHFCGCAVLLRPAHIYSFCYAVTEVEKKSY